MKLTPMTDFVLEQQHETPFKFGDNTDMINCIFRYAKFLKQILKLGMFVPCDEKGNVIDNPDETDYYQWDVAYDELKNQGYSTGSENETDKLIEAPKIYLIEYFIR